MSEENKTVELKDEELEKVSGGAPKNSYCANCGYFVAKNPNDGRKVDNCYYANSSFGTCKKFISDIYDPIHG